MADSPKQPSSPPEGHSPAKSVDRAAGVSWDSWAQHGNKTPQEALKDKPQSNPIDPSSLK